MIGTSQNFNKILNLKNIHGPLKFLIPSNLISLYSEDELQNLTHQIILLSMS